MKSNVSFFLVEPKEKSYVIHGVNIMNSSTHIFSEPDVINLPSDTIAFAVKGAIAIDSKNISKHLNQLIITSGRVVNVSSSSKNDLLLKIGIDNSNQNFTIVIRNNNMKNFDSPSRYNHKLIKVVGQVVLYEGKTAIDISDDRYNQIIPPPTSVPACSLQCLVHSIIILPYTQARMLAVAPLNVIGGKLTVMDTGNCDPQAVVQDIKDSLVNQCLIQALNQILLNQNINTTISTLINKIFNTNDKVNITYKESSSFVSTKLGNTVNDGYSLNSAGDTVLNITVSLNSNVLPGASQELIAVTILHEALHGYLDYTRIQGITGDPLAEHYYMSTKYIDLLRNAIQTTFHLNSGAVNALILSEMGDLAKSAPLTFDSIVVSHGLIHNGILDSLTLYENGTKGTPCH